LDFRPIGFDCEYELRRRGDSGLGKILQMRRIIRKRK
jgi:hypothetical protein